MERDENVLERDETVAAFPQGEKTAVGNRLHIRYLDGVRGAAALFVLLYHCQLIAGTHRPESWCPSWLGLWINWMTYGHYAVAVFIVLSGYCLALPVVRKTPQNLPAWWMEFARRRARRILPPYYAALVLSIALIVVGKVAHLSRSDGGLNLKSIGTHVLLVHNFTEHWSRSLDPPMWSVATEWQIYIVFALILLPLFLRFGVLSALAAAFAIGLAPHYLLPYTHDFDLHSASPWFLGGFAIGMSAAWVNFSAAPRALALRERVPWIWAALASLAAIVVVCAVNPPTPELRMREIPFLPRWGSDTVVEIVSAAFLIGLTQAAAHPSARRSLLLRFFDHPWLVGAGAFSYSIYLLHQPLLQIANGAAQHLHLNAVRSFAAELIAVPFVIGICYGFHLLFERPFMNSRDGKKIA